MSQADRIRQTAIEKYILPARAAGHADVIIRAGDLHSEMGLSNAMPSVCSVLRGTKFEQLAEVRRSDVTGPVNGANVYFRFDLIRRSGASGPLLSELSVPECRTATPPVTAVHSRVDLRDALVLVSCVKGKLSRAAPARELYCSDWFTKVRSLIESQNAHWFILSAMHGLVKPDREIAPYELTLNKMGVARRRAWAIQVYEALQPELRAYKRVVFFAGLRYREFLVGPILGAGRQVDIPMEGLAQGEQLSWLGDQE